MVNIEKHLLEIETCRKDHVERDNTFTVAILEQASEVAKELQKYRDAEEQGLLLRLPCKLGDTVWRITRYNSGKEWVSMGYDHLGEMGRYVDIYKYTYKKSTFTLDDIEDIGKTVFRTKEAAEQALTKMKVK